MWRERNPLCYGHRVTRSILFSKGMETDFIDLIVSEGVNGLHLYMWGEWQLLMVSDTCSLQLGNASAEAPSTPAKKG